MKISSLIVSIILVGLFAGVFGLFFSELSEQYNIDYNGSDTFGQNGSFDKIQDIQEQTETIEGGLKTDSTNTGITDLVGGFLKKGFAVIQVTFSSFELMFDMSNEAAEQLDTATGGTGVSQYFLPAVIGIISVLFIFIIISMLVGRDI